MMCKAMMATVQRCLGVGNAEALLRSVPFVKLHAYGWVRWRVRNWAESVDDVRGNNGPLFTGDVQVDF